MDTAIQGFLPVPDTAIAVVIRWNNTWHIKEHYRCRVFELTNGEEGNSLVKVIPDTPPPPPPPKPAPGELFSKRSMKEHTKICKMDDAGYPIHLCDCHALIPNISVGMEMKVMGKSCRVKDMWAVVDKEFCRQIIQVEETSNFEITPNEREELLKQMEKFGLRNP